MHSNERSMIDFVLVPGAIQVARTQVIGHMPIRTDHRLIIAEMRIPGKQERHPIGDDRKGIRG